MLVFRNSLLVASSSGGHHLDGLVSELERLLNDRCFDEAFLNTLERIGFFIECHDLDLAFLLGFLDGVQDRRAVVGPEANETGDISVCDEGVGDVLFGAGSVGVVGLRCVADDGDVATLEGFLETLESLFGVLLPNYHQLMLQFENLAH